MFVIVEIAGFQYKVKEGDKVEVSRLEEKEGKEIKLDKILVYSEGDDIRIGQPYLKNVKVEAKVLEHNRGDKVVAFKFRRRENYARKVGHRKDLTALTITKISV